MQILLKHKFIKQVAMVQQFVIITWAQFHKSCKYQLAKPRIEETDTTIVYNKFALLWLGCRTQLLSKEICQAVFYDSFMKLHIQTK